MNGSQKILPGTGEKLTKSLRSSLDVSTVRRAIEQKGWPLEEFAQKIGLETRALSVALSRGLPNRETRLKIEAILDYSISLATEPQRLLMRRKCTATLSFDFDLIGKPELRQKCSALNVRDWKSEDTSEGLRRKLLAHFAANPSLLNPKTQ